jgi:hypothetical protein
MLSSYTHWVIFPRCYWNYLVIHFILSQHHYFRGAYILSSAESKSAIRPTSPGIYLTQICQCHCMRRSACYSFYWPHPTRHIQSCWSCHYHHFFRLRYFLSYQGCPFHDRKHRVMTHSESEDLACILLVPEGKIFDISHWDQPLRGAWFDHFCYIGKCLWPLILS